MGNPVGILLAQDGDAVLVLEKQVRASAVVEVRHVHQPVRGDANRIGGDRLAIMTGGI